MIQTTNSDPIGVPRRCPFYISHEILPNYVREVSGPNDSDLRDLFRPNNAV